MRNKKNLVSLALGILVALTLAPAVASAGHYSTFEVSEDITRFIFDDAPVLDNGFPAAGNSFVTQGYIYPEGTLSQDENGVWNGVNPDGSPEFPDQVIGTWTCRGWFIGEGIATVSGPVVITHQLYEFDQSGRGRRSLASDGTELADAGVEVARAITGGTGIYKRARGQIHQTLLGLNAGEGVVLRFRTQLRWW